MRVMHMPGRVLLAMTGDEAHHLSTALQHTLYRVGHLTQIYRILDLRAPAFRLDHDGVVQLDAVFARGNEFRIKVEGPYSQMRILACNNGEYLLRSVGVVILAVVKISQGHIVLKAARNRLQLGRRGEAAADGSVVMRRRAGRPLCC